jgi:S-formylglutathione hydrolase
MKFHIYLPPAAVAGQKVGFLLFLSGLTCTDENFIQKAGAQRWAGKHNLALVCPDTSPRGVSIEGDSESWDFGVAAGFYINATEEKWKTNYNMYSYVTEELLALVGEKFPLDLGKAGIFGHSMGGHGALMVGLKNPDKFKSISAFAPICNPINCAWGKKAFGGYLGADESTWNQYDSTELLKSAGGSFNILIDQGAGDKFYPDQLLPENFVKASEGTKHSVELRIQDGYDHGYNFIATFVEDHINHHAKVLA